MQAPGLTKQLPIPLLPLFVFLYPLVFFPGTLFGRPEVITALDNLNASEQFLYLPKLLVLLLFGALGLFEVRRHIPRAAFVGLLALHLVLAVLSTLNARDHIAYNLLGPSQRFDGLVYQFGLVAIGLYAYVKLRLAPKSLHTVLMAFVLGASVQAVLVCLQSLGFDPVTSLRLWQPQWPNMPAPLGIIGHQGMVAALLLPALLVALWLGYTAASPLNPWMFATVLIAVGMGATGNSASFYALLCGLLTMNLVRRDWRLVVLSLLAVGAVIGFREVAFQVHKVANAGVQDYQNTTTLRSRFVMWQITLDAIAHTPLQPFIGGGSDALKLAQLRHPPLDLLPSQYAIELNWPTDAMVKRIWVEPSLGTASSLRDQVVMVEFSRYEGLSHVVKSYSFILDRAHNYLLDRFVAFGFFGMLIWLLLYALPVWWGLRQRHLLGWTLLALGVYYVAWFPAMQVEPLHVVLMAAAWAILPTPEVKP